MRSFIFKIVCGLLMAFLLFNMCVPVILAYEDGFDEDNEIGQNIISNIEENDDIIDEADNNVIEDKINNNISNSILENKINNNISNSMLENNANKENETVDIKKDNEISDMINESMIEQKKQEDADGEGLIMPLSINNEPSVSYRTHVQNIGWQDWKQNGDIAGTEGKSLRLEAISIKLTDIPNVNIKYQVHVQNIGWQDWKQNGDIAGTEGKSLRLEAIRIKLETSEEYTIMYRAHIQNVGWQEWKTDGELSGTEGKSLRIEAIQIKIVSKRKKGKMYIETPLDGTTYNRPKNISISGWKMANISDTKLKVYVDGNNTPIDESLIKYTQRADVLKAIVDYGTSSQNPNPGFTISVNAENMKTGKHTIKIVLVDKNGQMLSEITKTINVDNELHVEYSSHIQGIGWQGYKRDGVLSGTEGRSLRLEAIVMKLVNAPSNARICYRTHIQNIGWQEWKTANDLSGTKGRSLRVEAIEIVLENMEEYTVEYQVHIQNIGWSNWYIDGETAGTVGQSKRIEAIRIRIVPKYKRQYKGIDISENNGSVNWALVKRDNIDFAMIRIGYRGYGQAGRIVEDSKGKLNIEAAKKAGVKVGVYFYTQAINETEAIEEANWILNTIKGYSVDYPVAIDFENSGANGRADNLDINTRTKIAKAFCQTIQNAGYTPMVYTNVNWANNYINMNELTKYETWIAHWTYNTAKLPSYNKSYTMWQYSNKGIVNGVPGNVDLNIGYKKY